MEKVVMNLKTENKLLNQEAKEERNKQQQTVSEVE